MPLICPRKHRDELHHYFPPHKWDWFFLGDEVVFNTVWFDCTEQGWGYWDRRRNLTFFELDSDDQIYLYNFYMENYCWEKTT